MKLLSAEIKRETSEYQMQDEVEQKLLKQSYLVGTYPLDKYVKPKVFREVRVSEISRISDIVLMVNERKIVNIECKLTDLEGVLSQAKDHLKWADYSVICMHKNCFIGKRDLQKVINEGIGLMLWEPGNLFEMLVSVHNPYNKGIKDKGIRNSVMLRLKELSAKLTAKNHIQTKLY